MTCRHYTVWLPTRTRRNISPDFKRNSAIGNEKTVLLCKDNKLPFIKITKGEYLQITEAAVAMKYDTEKKKIYAENKNNQRNIDYLMKYLNENNEKRILCLKNNKEKYKNRLQEPAQIYTDQPSILLENFPDIFEGTGAGSVKLFVYKIDPLPLSFAKRTNPSGS